MGKKNKKSKPDRAGSIKDRPPGPGERVLDNGLVYGRWYDGAPQDCPNGCHGVPEGQHVPPCSLNTSQRAPVEDPDGEPTSTEVAAHG